MARLITSLVVLSALSLPTTFATFHSVNDAHYSNSRIVFSIISPNDGVYASSVVHKGLITYRVKVNGRSFLKDQNQHQNMFQLRRGINTIEIITDNVEKVSGLKIEGTSCASAYKNAPLFLTLEAEGPNAVCQGEILNTSFQSYTDIPHLAAEASNRSACQLTEPGQFVEFVTPQSMNAIAIRYSIPDSISGGGINLPLNVTVEGVGTREIELTSAYSWYYGKYPFTNNPSEKAAHHFYDEIRVLLEHTVDAGKKIRLTMTTDKAVVQSVKTQSSNIYSDSNQNKKVVEESESATSYTYSLKAPFLPPPAQLCDKVAVAARKDCGFNGITQQQCSNKGCCYRESPNPNPQHHPWCYYPSKPSPSPSPKPSPTPQGVSITIDLIDIFDVQHPLEPPNEPYVSVLQVCIFVYMHVFMYICMYFLCIYVCICIAVCVCMSCIYVMRMFVC